MLFAMLFAMHELMVIEGTQVGKLDFWKVMPWLVYFRVYGMAVWAGTR